jgi:hypothetical protein
LGGDQEVRLDIAAVEPVGPWEELPSGEALVEGGAHAPLWCGGRRRHPRREASGMGNIPGVGAGERIAPPVSLPLTAGARLQVSGRGHTPR